MWWTYLRPQFELIWWPYVHDICLFLLFFYISGKKTWCADNMRRAAEDSPDANGRTVDFDHLNRRNEHTWIVWASKMRRPVGDTLSTTRSCACRDKCRMQRRTMLLWDGNLSRSWSPASSDLCWRLPSHWFFKDFSPTRTLLSWRPKGSIELYSWRNVEGCRRKMVLNFSRTCALFRFVRMFL
jgi:hypothetical protein